MSESAHTAPVRTVKRPSLIASSAAMKKVLSPSSLTKIRANAAVNPVLASAWYAAWPTTVFWVRTYPAHARAPSATARTAADLPLAFLGAASSPPSVPGAEMPAAAASGARVTFRRARPADRPRGTALGNPAPTPPSGPTEIRFGTACRARRSPVAARAASSTARLRWSSLWRSCPHRHLVPPVLLSRMPCRARVSCRVSRMCAPTAALTDEFLPVSARASTLCDVWERAEACYPRYRLGTRHCGSHCARWSCHRLDR